MYMYWYDIKNNLRENKLYCITIQHKHYVKASILNLAGKDVKSVKLVRVIDVCARTRPRLQTMCIHTPYASINTGRTMCLWNAWPCCIYSRLKSGNHSIMWQHFIPRKLILNILNGLLISQTLFFYWESFFKILQSFIDIWTFTTVLKLSLKIKQNKIKSTWITYCSSSCSKFCLNL